MNQGTVCSLEDDARDLSVDRITDICYRHWEEGDHIIQTYRDERRSFAQTEGNASGFESKG